VSPGDAVLCIIRRGKPYAQDAANGIGDQVRLISRTRAYASAAATKCGRSVAAIDELDLHLGRVGAVAPEVPQVPEPRRRLPDRHFASPDLERVVGWAGDLEAQADRLDHRGFDFWLVFDAISAKRAAASPQTCSR